MDNLFNDDPLECELGLALAERVHPKYAPVFDAMSLRDRAALALYFLPHSSKKEVLEVTRPSVVKWYCPFADQRVFPSGHRYVVNVYTGCQHGCEYCYAAGYVQMEPRCKKRFRESLCRDLAKLEEYALPPAPLHLSNSTDPLQPLELEQCDTLYTLEELAHYRERFTTVTLLTKNPAVLQDERYLAALKQLREPALRVEVSLAFWQESSRQLFDPAAPTVSSRLNAIGFLRRNDIPVVLRIDPLFPRGEVMSQFGLPDVQPLDDLRKLVSFAAKAKVEHLVYSVAKITRPRFGPLPKLMEQVRQVYECLAGELPLIFRGGSWRLPDPVASQQVVAPFLNLADEFGLTGMMCKENLLSTR